MKALTFLRALYCVDRRGRFLRGARAGALGCPRFHPRRSFPAQHPALLDASGFAHHPYQLLQRPNQRSLDRDFVTIAELPRLERLLDRVLRRYGAPRRGGMPLWLTEFGYQTHPPDPLGVSFAQQTAYLNEAEYIAYRDPHVRALSQFLLVDDRPVAGVSPSAREYWRTFQSGLVTLAGRAKPAYDAYRVPLWLPHRVHRRGDRRFHLWALVRPAPIGTPQTVDVQFARPRSGRGFRTVATLRTSNPRGFVDARVRLPGTGRVRVAWTAPDGTVLASRVVRVALR